MQRSVGKVKSSSLSSIERMNGKYTTATGGSGRKVMIVSKINSAEVAQAVPEMSKSPTSYTRMDAVS